MEKDLNEKIALVLGSTGSIGFRTAEIFAQRGAKTILNGRSAEGGVTAVRKLSEQDLHCHFEQGDACNHDDMLRVVGNVVTKLGVPDILVCSGGTVYPGPTPFLELSPEQIINGIQQRVASRLLPVHAIAPRMRDRKGGAIVFVTSDAARHPTPGEVLVGAAGAAIMLATKALAKEMSRWNIRVNCVNVTITSDTKRFDEIFSTPGFSKNLFSKALERFPSGKPPAASNVAEAIAFLASPRSAEITGQTISVNGGLSFGGW